MATLPDATLYRASKKIRRLLHYQANANIADEQSVPLFFGIKNISKQKL